MRTLNRMLFSCNPKSPGEHLTKPPPQCGTCGGFPLVSRGVGSVLILLFTVLRTEKKASVCRARCLLLDLKIFTVQLKAGTEFMQETGSRGSIYRDVSV